MKITDGKKTVEIKIQRWNGSGYDQDWSTDYFDAGTLPYNEETDTYTVANVDYCIDAAKTMMAHAVSMMPSQASLSATKTCASLSRSCKEVPLLILLYILLQPILLLFDLAKLQK